jgi:hypothetical protein
VGARVSAGLGHKMLPDRPSRMCRWKAGIGGRDASRETANGGSEFDSREDGNVARGRCRVGSWRL